MSIAPQKHPYRQRLRIVNPADIELHPDPEVQKCRYIHQIIQFIDDSGMAEVLESGADLSYEQSCFQTPVQVDLSRFFDVFGLNTHSLVPQRVPGEKNPYISGDTSALRCVLVWDEGGRNYRLGGDGLLCRVFFDKSHLFPVFYEAISQANIEAERLALETRKKVEAPNEGIKKDEEKVGIARRALRWLMGS